MNKLNWKMMRPLALHFGVTVLALNATSALADSYAQTILADNPLAYFRLEEQLGEGTAVDSSSTGAYAGTYVYSMDGLYPKMGQPGIDTNSVYFRTYTDEAGSAETSYVEIPYSEQLNPSGAFSAECWVRAMSISDTGTRAPFGSFEGWVTDAPGWFFYQTMNDPGNPSKWAWIMKGGGIWLVSAPLNIGEWYYLAASYDGTKVTFYVNGTVAGSADVPGYVPTTTKSTFIGAIPTGNWPFDGNVDEAAIYGTALTADQIQRHYQVGLTNFRAAEIPAEITQNPVAATAYAGREAKFTVGADGTTPLFFQWYKGETLIPDATNAVLTFICAYEDNGTTYKAQVTNAFGTVMSTEATLTVATDLEISAQPIAITRNIGSKAALRVGITGALPVTYQWYKGTAEINGATNAMLWLPKLTAADDASTFHVRVTNPWNTIDSDEVSLTVTPRAVEVPITGYAKVVMADDPVAYWRLDEPSDSTTAVDAAGSFDGTYDTSKGGTITYAVPTGIPGETNTAIAVKNNARVRVPYALELNPYGAFTAEAWVKPNTLGVNGQDYRTAFSSMGSGPTGWLVYQQPDNTWAWVIFADNWVSTWLYDTTDTITANTWYHIVLTREGSLFSFYVNGKLVASTEYDIYNPSRDGKTDFGWRNDDDWKSFDGAIDDVAFYNKALTAVQVLNHYQTSVKMSIQKDGNNVILTWPAGKLQQCDTVNGTYTDIDSATSPYSVAIGQGSKFFRIKL